MHLFRGLVLKVLYSFLMLFSLFSKNKKERFQIFIIRLNNWLVRLQWSKNNLPNRKIKLLLLLPHCLQDNGCNVRVTNNIYNCKRCGQCIISNIIEVTEDKDLSIFVATGGTIARRIVGDIKPDAIVAVACERDLSSGILDAFPIPVIGIINERPLGPCINTKVDKKSIIEAIEFFKDRNIN